MLHKGGGSTTCTGAGEEEEGMGTDGILKETDCRVRTVKTMIFAPIGGGQRRFLLPLIDSEAECRLCFSLQQSKKEVCAQLAPV